MKFFEYIRKSKTLIFASVLAILGVIQTQIVFFEQFMTPQMYGFFTMFVAGTVAVLRIITTTSLKDK